MKNKDFFQALHTMFSLMRQQIKDLRESKKKYPKVITVDFVLKCWENLLVK